MTRLAAVLLLIGLCSLPLLLAADPPAKKEPAPQTVAGFSLKDTQGKAVSLADFKDKQAVVVVFVGVECPLVNLYTHRLTELHAEFADKGVQFLAVYSNSHDSAEAVAAHAKQHKLPFPALKDESQRVADLFKTERTPEAVVLDKKGTVAYRGRIDDQYGIGIQRLQATRRDLAEALAELLAGKPISVARTDVTGCLIGREKKADTAAKVTYALQVSRIMQKHCQECHRPGQIAPFSLMTYEKTRGWAEMIKEVVTDRRMPPWHADPRFGKFQNDRSLPAEDRDALLAWIDQGCPKGDDKDLPRPRTFTGADGWMIGKPDVVLSMERECTVPAKAPLGWGLPYQYYRVKTNFDEDKWIQAAEARPGNRAVVHHILVYIEEKGKTPGRGEDRIGSNFLVGTAPGDMANVYAPGIAKKIPKGATLLFQMHYTPNGIEQNDRSSVGLIFAKEPPKHVMRTHTIVQTRFAIPPGEGNHQVEASSTFKKDFVLVSLMPHMHLRGKDFEYRVVYPDGKSEVLLSVPRFDFNWQSTYRLVKPIPLPAGTRIDCVAHFDNSKNNPNNPDPTKEVRWGDQTWQEMMIGWLDYYYVEETVAEK